MWVNLLLILSSFPIFTPFWRFRMYLLPSLVKWPPVACPFDSMSSGRHSCRLHLPHATICYPMTISLTWSWHPQLGVASLHTLLLPLTTTQMFINVCHFWNMTFLDLPPFPFLLCSLAPMGCAPLLLIPGCSRTSLQSASSLVKGAGLCLASLTCHFGLAECQQVSCCQLPASFDRF